MGLNIYKKDDKIIIEIPATQKRWNTYDREGDYGTYPTLTGMLCKDEYGNPECGFSNTIDMCYAGKPDQYSEIVIQWDGNEEEFIDICKKLDIGIVNFRDETTKE